MISNYDSYKISELPSITWPSLQNYFQKKINRTDINISEYLQQNNIIWIEGYDPSADFFIFKSDMDRSLSFRNIKYEILKELKKPYINLLGEPREYSRIAYFLADKAYTYAVAPGKKFKRFYFPCDWSDPKLDDWEKRINKFCWIGRPLPDRIQIAKKMSDLGLDVDIYSRERWPVQNWKGVSPDEIATSQQYKYRIVCENNQTHLYHSEKLFNSIRSGCVTFYLADPELVLPHLKGAYVPFNFESLLSKEEYCQNIMKGIEKVMFTDLWEFYSFKKFFDMFINCTQKFH